MSTSWRKQLAIFPSQTAKHRAVEAQAPQKSATREYGEAFGIALILALIIRTFFIQAYKIPSGSMEPTLLIGDHILVNKLIYGLAPARFAVRSHASPEFHGVITFFHSSRSIAAMWWCSCSRPIRPRISSSA